MARSKTVTLQARVDKLKDQLAELTDAYHDKAGELINTVVSLDKAEAELETLHSFLDQLPGAPPREFENVDRKIVVPTATARLIAWLANK